MGPVGLEFLSQKILLVHRSHSRVLLRHGHDERNPADVTAKSAGARQKSKTRWLASAT
jgi:hypothetical protein